MLPSHFARRLVAHASPSGSLRLLSPSHSALHPLYIRSASARHPLCIRTASALHPHCIRTASPGAHEQRDWSSSHSAREATAVICGAMPVVLALEPLTLTTSDMTMSPIAPLRRDSLLLHLAQTLLLLRLAQTPDCSARQGLLIALLHRDSSLLR